MLHGLLPDSAIVGTAKRIKNAGKGKRRRSTKVHSPTQDLRDLVDGITEIVSIYKDLKKLVKGK